MPKKTNVPLSPVIKSLKRWRKANDLSQQQAIDVMAARGYHLSISTLRSWEQGVISQGHQAEFALRAFLEKYPAIEDAPQYHRWATKAPSKRLAEMNKLREDGATYAQIGEKYGIGEARAWRVLNGNQRKVYKPRARKLG
jgi:hypothetical protein